MKLYHFFEFEMAETKITNPSDGNKVPTEKNFSDLNYWIFDKEYPIHSNAATLVAGNAGVGKSYFIFKRLLPIYIKYGNYKTILIASRMGKFDATTSAELDSPIYKDVLVEFIKIDDSYEMCQKIRANAIINEYLLQLTKVKSDKDLMKIHKKLSNLIKASGELTVVKNELLKLYSVVEKFMTITPEEIADYATLLYKRGSQITFNPVLIVFDDYSGTDAFIKPYSDIHKLIYCRRHLHLTMVMSVQSITTISANIKRNCTEFICFSTLSDVDVKLLRDRLPLKYNFQQLKEAFNHICEEDDRNQKIVTIFTTFPNDKLVIGLPECVLKSITEKNE